MGKRFIATEMWDDPEFIDIPAEAKTLWVYLFCKCDNSGVIKLSTRIANMVINGSIDIAKTIEILVTLGWVEVLSENKYFLPKFIQFQYGELTYECKPHRQVFELLKKHSLFERVLKGFQKGIERVQDKDKDKDMDIKGGVGGKSDTRFVKPTPEEVSEYAKSISFKLDGQYFVDSYESKGWLVGKNPMKNWKATVRTWQRREVEKTKANDFRENWVDPTSEEVMELLK